MMLRIRKEATRRAIVAVLLFSSGFLLCLSGCAETAELLPKGRCRINDDCGEGQRCKATYCEDIYFPRKDIKPY